MTALFSLMKAAYFVVTRLWIGILCIASGVALLAAPSTSCYGDVPGYPPSAYFVSPSGSDTNVGTSSLPFRTIQKGINMAQPGQVVEILPGSYSEKVVTIRSGTPSAPIALVGSSGSALPSVAGVEIRHGYVVVDGLSLDGNNPAVTDWTGAIYVRGGVTGCVIINNYIHDARLRLSGISFESSANPSQNCLVRNNTLERNGRHQIMVTGAYHVIENNTLKNSNGWDGIWLHGHHHIVRANFLAGIDEVANLGNHIDIFQGFDDQGAESHDMLVDGNFIVDSNAQVGQINNDRYSTRAYNWVFSNNVFTNMNLAYNLNLSIRGAKVHNNTFVGTGMVILGQVSDDSEIHSNAFVGNTSASSGLGWYSTPQGKLSPSLFWSQFSSYVTCPSLGLPYDSACQTEQKRLIKVNLLDDLRVKGYLGAPNANGEYPVLDSLLAVNDAASLQLQAPFTSFQDLILVTAKQVFLAARNFSAHNNFVSGSAPLFAAKSARCPVSYNPFNFCEPGGINGGDPGFRDIASPLGPDNLPFTADDGLRPVATSRLCNGGSGGSFIGAYSCSGTSVQVGASSSRMLPPQAIPTTPTPTPLPVARPNPPANVRIGL